MCSRSTKQLVAGVRFLHDALPAVVKPVLESIEAISQRFLELVEASKQRKARQPSPTKGNDGGATAAAAAAAAAATEFLAVSELFRVNHDLLCALGVGHPALTAAREASASVKVRMRAAAVAAVAGAGAEAAAAEVPVVDAALQCKLTGAGGGGCAITLLPPPAAQAVLVPPAGAAASAGAGADGCAAVAEALRASLQTAGFETFESSLAGGGVRWHVV